jgi:two-component system sensor histidine kinase MtrB
MAADEAPPETRGESAPRTSIGDALRRFGSVAAEPFERLLHLWRRSIQARVVIGTLALSAVLAILAGWVMLSRVTDGVVDSREQTAVSQAVAGVETAQSTLAAKEIGDPFDVGPALNELIELLSPRDAARDDYYVVITGPTSVDSPPGDDGGSRGASAIRLDESLPNDLVARVRLEPGTFSAFTRVYYTDGAPSDPGFAVGSQIRIPSTDQTIALFYVFPLAEQEETLAVVQGALITAGAVLVVLLGTIAWLVTRQVVTPVRLARRIAERLAAGRLEERMQVRGEDDIARLGTSFNQMATSLQIQIRQLEELSRVQRRFVADVSHELRTPLTTVRMAADVLYDHRNDFDASTARSAELLQVQLDRFELLLTDLLEISRFDAGAAVLELSDVDLGDLARRVIDGAEGALQRRGSTITFNAPGKPVVVEADVRRIERIVRNLVVNAIEYGEGRPIEVRVAANADAAAMSVRDHGLGLRPGEEVLVFNRFWRADPARAKTRGGTGLGLSIAVEDTELHEGKLDAWGRPGEGSVFRLTLPRRVGTRFVSSPLPLAPSFAGQVSVGGPYARYDSEDREGAR